MQRVVLDASVILKWFLIPEEKDREKALYFRNEHVDKKLKIIIPDYCLVEIAAVLKKKRLVDTLIDTAIKTLTNLKLQKVQVDLRLLEQSISIATRYGLEVYDSTYIAVALKEQCGFITADAVAFRKIKKDLNFAKLLDSFDNFPT